MFYVYVFLTPSYRSNTLKKYKPKVLPFPSLSVESVADRFLLVLYAVLKGKSQGYVTFPATKTSAPAFILFSLSPGLVMKYSDMLILVRQISLVLCFFSVFCL